MMRRVLRRGSIPTSRPSTSRAPRVFRPLSLRMLRCMFVGGRGTWSYKYATAANDMCFFSLDFSCIVKPCCCLVSSVMSSVIESSCVRNPVESTKPGGYFIWHVQCTNFTSFHGKQTRQYPLSKLKSILEAILRILSVESLSSPTTRISIQYAQISPGDHHPCTVCGLPIL